MRASDRVKWIARLGGRDATRQATLERAVAAIDRELAANLELMTMFDQTRQAIVLEIGAFGIHGAVLAREAPEVHAETAALYARVPETETAMERRGPVNTIRDEDRLTIEGWEGDARHIQRELRRAAGPRAPLWLRALTRLRGRPAPD